MPMSPKGVMMREVKPLPAPEAQPELTECRAVVGVLNQNQAALPVEKRWQEPDHALLQEPRSPGHRGENVTQPGYRIDLRIGLAERRYRSIDAALQPGVVHDLGVDLVLDAPGDDRVGVMHHVLRAGWKTRARRRGAGGGSRERDRDRGRDQQTRDPSHARYSTVTDFARFRGRSTSRPCNTAT